MNSGLLQLDTFISHTNKISIKLLSIECTEGRHLKERKDVNVRWSDISLNEIS